MAKTKAEPEVPDEESPIISDDMAHQLFDARKAVRSCESKYDDADANRKAAKASLERSQDQLNELIDEIERGPGPLFEEPPSPDGWRTASLEDILGPGRLATALAENDPSIKTLGELTDWQKIKGDFWAKDIPGVGPKAVEKLDEATTVFWEEHSLFCQGDGTEDEDDDEA